MIRRRLPIEEAFEMHSRLITKKAHQYARKTNYNDLDDIVAQANLIFVETYRQYKPTRASFVTYLWHNLEYKLTSYCRSMAMEMECREAVDCLDKISQEHPIRPLDGTRTISKDLGLSLDAEKLLAEIFEAPLEKISGKSKKVTKKSIKRHIIRDKKWTHRKTNHAMEEIKNAWRRHEEGLAFA